MCLLSDAMIRCDKNGIKDVSSLRKVEFCNSIKCTSNVNLAEYATLSISI